MCIFITNLDEDTPGLRKQIAGDDKAVTKICQIGVNTKLPCVSECLDLLRLSRGILDSPIFHITFAGAHLPVGTKLDAVGRVNVDGLHLAL